MTDPPTPVVWQPATVAAITRETTTAKTFRLRLSRPQPHRAGQHYLVRLTAPDGYAATRSYSVASPPGDPGHIDVTVERLAGGEVSPFLHDVTEVGDVIDVRGPLGGWFVWDATVPALLVAGGSGLVPCMSMLRLARQLGRSDLVRLVVSVRTPADLYYATEVPGPETTVVHTRVAPSGDPRPPGRLSNTDLPADIARWSRAYVCGSSSFANHATDLLIARGMNPAAIRVERFGPTGDESMRLSHAVPQPGPTVTAPPTCEEEP